MGLIKLALQPLQLKIVNCASHFQFDSEGLSLVLVCAVTRWSCIAACKRCTPSISLSIVIAVGLVLEFNVNHRRFAPASTKSKNRIWWN